MSKFPTSDSESELAVQKKNILFGSWLRLRLSTVCSQHIKECRHASLPARPTKHTSNTVRMFKSLLVSSLIAGVALGAAAPAPTPAKGETPANATTPAATTPAATSPDAKAEACMKAIQADCTTCVSGDINAIVNRTCLGDCFGDNANVKKACPTIAAEVKCYNTLQDTCGSCVKPGFLSMAELSPSCFESCYKNHNKTLLAACPLPEPVQKAVACHKSLAKTCGDCVSGEHDIDTECLKGCWDDNVSTLNKTCPGALGDAVQVISNLPSEEDIMSFISNLLSGSAGDSDFLSNLLGAEVVNEAQDMGAGFEALIGNLGNVLGNLVQQIQGAGSASADTKPQTPTKPTGSPDQQDPAAAIQQLLGQIFGGVQQQQQQPSADSTQGQAVQGPAGAASIEDFVAQLFGGALPPGTQISVVPVTAAGSADEAPAPVPTPAKPTPAKPTQEPAQAAGSPDSDAATTAAINNALQSFLGGQQQ